MGCGSGAVAARISERGLVVTGVDINAGAVEAARVAVPTGLFFAADVSSPCELDASGSTPYDGVVCQLLLSIVGTAAERRQTLINAHSVLAPAGAFCILFGAKRRHQ